MNDKVNDKVKWMKDKVIKWMNKEPRLEAFIQMLDELHAS